MMSHFDRRSFMKAGALAAAWPAGLLDYSAMGAPATPSMSIARYRNPPTAPDGIAEEAERLTRRAIESLGGMSRFVSKGELVWVKPNLGWDRRPEQAATTNPDVVATVVKLCYEAGAKQVMVSDHTCNTAQRTYPRSGVQPAAEKAGARVVFVDERKFKRMAIKGKVLREWEVYVDIVEADKLINIPIVKHHGLCRATLGMKNLMGAIGGQRNRYHQDLNNTLTDLAAFLKPALIVLDAVRVLAANGPIGGNLADVKRMDTVAAGVDQVAIDAFGATLLGAQPQQVGYIVEAASRGLGTMNFNSLSPKEITL